MPIAAVIGGVGLLGTGASLYGASEQANAAETAAQEQSQADANALAFQEQVWGEQQQNIAPYLQAGDTSLSTLMEALKGGSFGPGSLTAPTAGSFGPLPNAPTAAGYGPLPSLPTPFQAPTLAQAEAQPGYQFSETEGEKGIAQLSAAAGGAVSGGTLRAADQFAQANAENDYTNVFNQSLSGYNAALAQYGAGLQGYQTNEAAQNAAYEAQLQKYSTGEQAQLGAFGAQESAQQQEFQQLEAPVAAGLSGAASLNSSGTAASANIAQIMAALGNAQAAGTVGSANAISSGLTGATNSISQAALLNLLLNPNGGVGGVGSTTLPTSLGNSSAGIGAGVSYIPVSAPTVPTVTSDVGSGGFGDLGAAFGLGPG